MIRPRLLVLVLVLAVPLAAAAQEKPAGEADEADAPAGAPAEATAAVDPAAAPPPVEPDAPALLGYSVRGALAESEAELRAALDPLLRPGQPWDAGAQKSVLDLLERLRYQVAPPTVERRAGGVWVTFELRPYTLIRHVEVSGTGSFLTELYEDDVKRRLRLREGSPVPDDPRDREQVLDEEARRVEEWLARQGFFEARVAIYARDDGPYALRLHIRINRGPAYTLGTITVTGNDSIPDEKIVEIMQQDAWFGLSRDRFSKDELNADLDRVKALYRRNGFPGVRVTTDFDPATSPDRRTKKVNLTVVVRERKKIDVAFEGNARVSADVLERALTFEAEGSYDDYEVERSADAIRRLYQSRGFFQASVTWERVHLLPTFERVLFHIDEGPRQRVERITFVGNRSIPTAELEGVIATKPFPSFALFASGGYVTSVQLEQDRQAIEDVYRRRGYAEVEVRVAVANHPSLLDDVGATAAAATAEQLGARLYIRFTVHEGPAHRVGTVEFRGNRHVNDRDLERVTRLRRGGAFTAAAVQDDGDAIRRHYQERGYPYANIQSKVVQRDGGTVWNVVHTIDEGSQVRVGKVFVRGNFRTRDWVIRDVLGLREGQILTLGGIQRGRNALLASGLFSSVRLDLLGYEAKRDPVHPLIEVQERHDHTADGDFGAGWSTDNDLFASATGHLRNIGRIGASASLRAEVGLQIQYGRADLRFPYWITRRAIGIPVDTTGFVFYRNEDTERYGELEQLGAGVDFVRQLSESVFLSVRYNFTQKQIDEPLVRGAGADEDLATTKATIRTGSVGAFLVLDRRTDARGNPVPIGATRGHRLSFSVSYASPYLGGSDEFLKFGTDAQFLTPLSRRVLVTNGLRYDHGVPLGDSVILPETERFLAGGDTTVRGIEEDRLLTEVVRGPLPPIGGVEQFRVIPAGGNIRIIHNVDLQFQVWERSVLFGLPIASAIFFDTGVVTNSFARFKPAKLRHSVGIAFLRLMSPIGSFSFEYAIPLDPGVGDDPTGRFHFNLGFVMAF